MGTEMSHKRLVPTPCDYYTLPKLFAHQAHLDGTFLVSKYGKQVERSKSGTLREYPLLSALATEAYRECNQNSCAPLLKNIGPLHRHYITT